MRAELVGLGVIVADGVLGYVGILPLAVAVVVLIVAVVALLELEAAPPRPRWR